MSLLDTRYPELDLFLQRWQRRLNGRFLSGEAGLAVAVGAPLAVLAAALLAPNEGWRWALWAGLTAVTATGYTVARKGHRLTRSQAASWLDEKAQARGLFRAAAECLERDEIGATGQKVLEEADRRKGLLTGPMAPRLPLRRWALRLLLAATVLAGSAGALTWSVPALLPLSLASALASTPDGEAAPAVPESDARQLTPKEAAKRLFPEDERLAALAEQALASGDPGALESLLEQNAESVDRSALPPGSGGPPRGGAGSNPETGVNPGDQATPGSGQGSPNRSAQPYLPGNSPEDSKSDGSSEQGPSPREPEEEGGSSAQGGQGSSRGQGSQGGPGQSDGTQTPFSSGGAPGFGHSQQPLGVRPKTGQSDRTLTLKDPTALGLFEYVLPGSEAELPTAQTLADSRRSAEAVLSKSSPPLEFENTIRDYFLSLSQEVTP